MSIEQNNWYAISEGDTIYDIAEGAGFSKWQWPLIWEHEKNKEERKKSWPKGKQSSVRRIAAHASGLKIWIPPLNPIKITQNTDELIRTTIKRNLPDRADVYWAARDLGRSPWGNHHFVLIETDDELFIEEFGVEYETESNIFFFTLATFESDDGYLVYEQNDDMDVSSVKEDINSDKKGRFIDYDLEKHRVKIPNDKTDKEFINTLLQLVENYKVYNKPKKIEYDYWDFNCAAWVNSLFKAADINRTERLELGEFKGWDWGEEDEVPGFSS